MKIKEQVLAIIERMDFSEYIEEKGRCPKCYKNTLVRHIQREQQQKRAGRWHVEYCTDEGCAYWNCGFLR